jgi:hypothetical protein
MKTCNKSSEKSGKVIWKCNFVTKGNSFVNPNKTGAKQLQQM